MGILIGIGNIKFNKLISGSVVDEIPTGLTLTVINDSRIDMLWINPGVYHDGHKIERSPDNTTWTVIGTVLGATLNYSDTTCLPSTRYYYRVRAYKGLLYSAYTSTANDWSASRFVLTSTGSGAGLGIFDIIGVSSDVTITVDGTAKLYDDAIGSGEDTTKVFTTIIFRLWVKVPNATANVLFFGKGNILEFGRVISGQDFYVGGTNKPTIAVDALQLPRTLTNFAVQNGTCIVTGTVAQLPRTLLYCALYNWVDAVNICMISGTLGGTPPNIIMFQMGQGNTISGDVASCPNTCTQIYMRGSNSISDYTTKVWGTTMNEIVLLSASGGLTTAEVDQLIIDCASTIVTWTDNKRIIIQGTNAARSAASNAAVATLVGRGCAVSAP